MQINKIYLGDCLDLIKELPDESIDSVINDPPYHQGLTHNGVKGTVADLSICRPFFRELITEINRVLKPDGFLYWFCGFRSQSFYYPLIDETIPVKNTLIWNKTGRVCQVYGMTYEQIIFAPKGACNIVKPSIIKQPGFSAGARCYDGNKVHPTQKPTKLISELICDCTQEGDIVLDCFAGSCTTAVSAIYSKRNFICFEMQEKYVEIGEKRVENAMCGSTLTQTEIKQASPDLWASALCECVI
jgi:site-specific DNA-methyltransferase (adenine-specific)